MSHDDDDDRIPVVPRSRSEAPPADDGADDGDRGDVALPPARRSARRAPTSPAAAERATAAAARRRRAAAEAADAEREQREAEEEAAREEAEAAAAAGHFDDPRTEPRDEAPRRSSAPAPAPRGGATVTGPPAARRAAEFASNVGAVFATIGNALTGSARREEAAIDERLALRTVDRPYIIGVVSSRGGTGKTTTTTALGDVLSETCRLRVCAIDMDLDFGSLRGASEPRGRSDEGLEELGHAWAEADATTAAQLHRYAGHRRSGLHIFAPGDQTPRASNTSYRAAVDRLTEHYDVVLMDLGAGLNTEDSWIITLALKVADQIVMATRMDSRDAASTVSALRHIRLNLSDERGHEIPQTLVVTRTQRRQRDEYKRTLQEVERGQVEWVEIPEEERVRNMTGSAARRLETMPRAVRLPYKRLAEGILDRMDGEREGLR